jgi:hypothetical protein
MTKRLTRRLLAAASAPLVFVCVTAGAAFLYLLLGVLIGVFGICATAPGWWVWLYFCLSPVLLVFGFRVANYVHQQMSRTPV